MEPPLLPSSCLAERLLGGSFYHAIHQDSDSDTSARPTGSPLRCGCVTINILPKSSTAHTAHTSNTAQAEIDILRSIAYMRSVQTFYGEYETPTEIRRVVERCDLGELADLVCKRAIPTPVVYRLFVDLCRAVASLHDIGICHRNISLRTILLAGDGTVRLTGFGFAHQHDMDSDFKYRDDTPLSHPCGDLVETMAPEMVAGAKYSGEKVDSWAIGVVFFTLLTGSPPFQIASVEDPGFRYLKTMGVRAFLSAWPGLPLALSDVHHAFLLEHLLEAHDPAKRLTARDIRQMTRLDALVSSFMVVNHAREVLLAT